MNLNSGSTNYLVYDFIKKIIIKIFRVNLSVSSVCSFLSRGCLQTRLLQMCFCLAAGSLTLAGDKSVVRVSLVIECNANVTNMTRYPEVGAF